MVGSRGREALLKALLALGLMLAGGGGPMWPGTAYAQVATTTVSDTVYHADGTPAAGTVIVSWQAFSTMTGASVPGGSTSVTIGAGGALSVALAPNVGATPIGSYYTVVYHLDDGSTQREFWVVPVSSVSVKLSAVKSSVLPTSVAMQTVSKSYVDTAIAAAVSGHALEATPYVLKAGDTMTGALVLPGDPVSANQAADKNYVDTQVASVGGGVGQKVSTLPSATQVVVQPTGTDLEVNRLNGVEFASQYATGGGNNGIAGATASTDCNGASTGCLVVVEPTVPMGENPSPTTWGDGTHVVDQRSGARHDIYFNPRNQTNNGDEAGQTVQVISTQSTQMIHQQTGLQGVQSAAFEVTHAALTGGSNLFPENIENPPYFKSNYVALPVEGDYNTQGQHVLVPMQTNCYAVGDCLIGSQFIHTSGGFRDSGDEGAHPYDIQISEDTRVFQGTCATGCTTGSRTVTVGSQANSNTQGDGRFLIDKNPAKVMTSGSLTGGSSSGIHASAAFSGSAFAVSTFFTTAALIPSQTTDLAPGTVTFAIATTGVPSGYATNTAAAPAGSGVACVADRVSGFSPPNYEMANYTVVDGTHLRMTLAKPHAALATIAMGGLCGYGIEQTVDTVGSIRQVFPVIGSTSATSLIYAGALTPIVGMAGSTSGYRNMSMAVAGAARSGNVVTLTAAGSLPFDVNGLTVTVAGMADASYNGSFAVTSTGPTTVTYASTGADSTSSGGTIAYVTGGYALYPMAEVTSVYNTATKSVDGQMTLAPNNVAWAAGDAVEEPHYFQIATGGDITLVTQTMPRPGLFQRQGYQYNGNNGPGLQGFQVNNSTPASSYVGNGGTHYFPDIAYVSSGIWNRTFDVQTGETALFAVHCNSKGCNRWNSAYDLLELDNAAGVDTLNFQPQTSNMTLSLRGTTFGFSPLGFSTNTANIGTLNVTTLNGALNAGSISSGTIGAARLPVMGASGTGHAVGAVPDAGATAGTTHFLREDGTWSVPAGGGGSGAGGALAVLPALNTGLLADYNFYQQGGTSLTDMSGNGNHGTLQTGGLAPTWTGTGLQFLPGQGVSLPAALNPGRSFVIEAYLNPIVPGFATNSYPVLVSSSGGGTGVNLLTIYATNSGNYGTFSAYAPSIYANSAHTSSAPNLYSGFHVLGYTLGTGSGDLDHFYIDGVEVGSYLSQAASAGLQTSGNLFFGSSNAGPWVGSGINGTAYRMRVYSRELAASEVASLSQAMVAEVAQRGVATGPVLINLAVPQLHAVGDSITYGTNAAAGWPALLSLTNQPAYAISNWGIPGVTLEAIDASEANRVGVRCRTSAGPAVATVFAGTNDFTLPGLTLQTIFGTLMGEVQTLKQAGCRVFVGTMLSRTGNDAGGATLDSDKNAYNALILAQARGGGADGIIDFAANPLLGADGANAGSYFGSDHIHPTSAGQQLLANAASNALNYYFGANEMSPKAVTAMPYAMAAGDGSVSLAGLTNAGAMTLPDCTGQSGAVYRVNNPQSTYAVTVTGLNTSQPINGLTSGVTVPANGSVVLRDVPNPKTMSGCHWEM